MLRRGAPLPKSWLHRFLSSSANARRPKALNLTPYVSPLLLRLHPDKLQRQNPTLAQANEEALKQLNVFLELATLGCNNDAYNARPQNEAEQDAGHQDFVEVKHIVQVPGRLMKRTLSNPGRSPTDRTDPQVALRAPFARDWQRTTRRILQDLFEVAHVPLGQIGDEKMTVLAEWIAEGDTVEDQADMHGVRIGERNREVKMQHQQFDKFFHSLLTREKNIVQEFTTGLEDGPTTQHAVLTSLLHSRLFLPKFSDPHMKKSAFHWVANILLVNFMELRLHSLVWNKITLLVTVDEDVKDPQVSWDDESPGQGMGILIPIGMDVDTLIDFIYEHVEELEMALEEKSARDQAAFKKEHQRRRREKQKKKGTQGRRQRQHFYEDEMNAILGK
ncbi:hypothetical protein BBJ29_009499 [Phytophthora kernoviae]|uniref:DUF4460 domain-containing protein n=1 Tax=Phytophthora kernoviae TaxID=325452 RepID=A0A3F2RCG2_9STRA|nr:hypothetical protein BBP00_00009489 [Phytophthora kernoviae]RLN66216.1 hypothetical protein BBJ29_009499 [Phytophthora kernoviae]